MSEVDPTSQQPLLHPVGEPYGLLLFGPGIDRLKPYEREALQDMAMRMAGGLTVRMAIVPQPEATYGLEPNREAVVSTRDDFRAFAVSNGYPDRRGYSAWDKIDYTDLRLQRGETSDRFPRLRYLDERYPRESEVLDLRSVYARLIASKYDPSAWYRGTKGFVDFVAHLTDDKLSAEQADGS